MNDRDDHRPHHHHLFTSNSAAPPAHLGRRRRRRHRAASVAAALVGLALAAAACSSGPSAPGVAGLGSTSTTAPANQASSGSQGHGASSELAFSQCMRAHGVTNFPDPNGKGQLQIVGGPNSSSGLDPNSPTFQKAQKACQSLMPAPTPSQKAHALAKALQQAKCMRAHGIKDFPDPQSSDGRISMKINGSAGSDLNPNNPLFQKAQQVCMPNAPKVPPKGGTKTSGNGGSGGSGAATFGAGA